MSSLRYVLKSLVCAAALVSASACASTEESREASAVRTFHRQLQSGQLDQIYEGSSEFLRGQLSDAQFRKFLWQTRSLGAFQDTARAHYERTQVPGKPDLIVAFYNTRYEKASCLESFSWHVEASGDLKLATYSCAPNMKVTCGPKCETSPVPEPSFASLP
jgi:hypothetical protein